MIFFGFRPLYGEDNSFVADGSPNCLKLLLYLVANKTKFEYSSLIRNQNLRPGSSPNQGVLPFVQFRAEIFKYVADADVIIRKIGNPLDAKLDPTQVATSHLLRNLIDYSCCWTIGWNWRWADSKLCGSKTTEIYMQNMALGTKQRKKIMKEGRKVQLDRLEAVGRGRSTIEDRIQQGIKDLQTIEQLLSDYDGGYFFRGMAATSIDCVLYAMTANAIFTAKNYPAPAHSPVQRLKRGEFPKIMAHYRFMSAVFERLLRKIVDPKRILTEEEEYSLDIGKRLEVKRDQVNEPKPWYEKLTEEKDLKDEVADEEKKSATLIVHQKEEEKEKEEEIEKKEVEGDEAKDDASEQKEEIDGKDEVINDKEIKETEEDEAKDVKDESEQETKTDEKEEDSNEQDDVAAPASESAADEEASDGESSEKKTPWFLKIIGKDNKKNQNENDKDENNTDEEEGKDSPKENENSNGDKAEEKLDDEKNDDVDDDKENNTGEATDNNEPEIPENVKDDSEKESDKTENEQVEEEKVMNEEKDGSKPTAEKA